MSCRKKGTGHHTVGGCRARRWICPFSRRQTTSSTWKGARGCSKHQFQMSSLQRAYQQTHLPRRLLHSGGWFQALGSPHHASPAACFHRMAQKTKPSNEFGPHMEWREHSFLRNRRMPATVRKSRVRIVICRCISVGSQKGSDFIRPGPHWVEACNSCGLGPCRGSSVCKTLGIVWCRG